MTLVMVEHDNFYFKRDVGIGSRFQITIGIRILKQATSRLKTTSIVTGVKEDKQGGQGLNGGGIWGEKEV